MCKPHVKEYRITAADGHVVVEKEMTYGEAKRVAKEFGAGSRIEVKKPEGKWFKFN